MGGGGGTNNSVTQVTTPWWEGRGLKLKKEGRDAGIFFPSFLPWPGSALEWGSIAGRFSVTLYLGVLGHSTWLKSEDISWVVSDK